MSGCSFKLKDPADYFNPNIGTIGHLLVATDPIVQMPQSMVKLSSNPWPDITDRLLKRKNYQHVVQIECCLCNHLNAL